MNDCVCSVCGRQYRSVTVFPVHCRCGHHEHVPTSLPSKPRPHTFSTILREMIGCGCKLPFNKWDNHGLQWCKKNTNTIVEHLIRKPKPGLERNKAIEMVHLAIKIVESK